MENSEQVPPGASGKLQGNRRSEDQVRVPLQSIMDVLIGLLRYIFVGVVLCAAVLVFVCWILALSAYQRFGFALDPKTYATVVTVVAVTATLAFIYFVTSWVRHGSGVADGK